VLGMQRKRMHAAPVAYLCCCCCLRLTLLAPAPAQQHRQQAWHTPASWSLERLVLMTARPAQPSSTHKAALCCQTTPAQNREDDPAPEDKTGTCMMQSSS
jgi:hypothetical protein